MPGANEQGRTKDEARRSLAEGIALVLEDRRDDGLRGVPDDAERETILVEIPGAASVRPIRADPPHRNEVRRGGRGR